jgi:predicted Zn-dependent peptidase
MLDRKTPPAFKKSSAFTLIQPEKETLSNGITISYVNGGSQEVTKIEFIFNASKWYEGQSGVSYFTAHLLQKGTPTKNSFQISSELDQYGVHLEVSPGYDFTSLSLYGLTKNIGRLLKLSREIITQPIFPDIELQQAKDIYIQGLKINLEKTSYLASRLLRENLFGKEHPYGRDADVTDIELIKRTDLANFHHDYFKNLEVICSGKITDEVKKELRSILTDFEISTGSKKAAPKLNPGPPVEFVKKENTVQSSIRFGKRSIPRTHSDYPALLMLNHIFGGFFGSRLMKNIREEKGLTYGIYSSLVTLKHDGYLSIGADVNNENRGIVIEEIKNELKNLQAQPMDSNELKIARNHFIGSLQAEITTPFAHADKIKNIILYKLPENFYQSLINKIESLNSRDLLDTAHKYFDDTEFHVVSAG